MTRKNSFAEKNQAKREARKHPEYGSWKMMWFINCMMKDGKFSIAYKHFTNAMNKIIESTNTANLKGEERIEYGIEIFEKIVKAVRPLAKVKTQKIGGANYQVPEQVSELDGTRLAFKWIIKHSRKRKGKTFSEKLFLEFKDVLEGRGGAVGERLTSHKMALANLAFGGKASFLDEDQN